VPGAHRGPVVWLRRRPATAARHVWVRRPRKVGPSGLDRARMSGGLLRVGRGVADRAAAWDPSCWMRGRWIHAAGVAQRRLLCLRPRVPFYPPFPQRILAAATADIITSSPYSVSVSRNSGNKNESPPT